MNNSETVGGPRNHQEITECILKGMCVSVCVIDDSFSVIAERHHISYRVGRNESVVDNNCMPVEKLTENIVGMKNIVQKLVDANQSWERRYQEFQLFEVLQNKLLF